MKPKTPCWIWPGSKDRYGYGLIANGRGGCKTVHRMMWSAVHGPIPRGKELHHKCFVPACFRPSHMQAMSHGDNMALGPNNPAHLNTLKSQCNRGHRFDSKNTYHHSKRGRPARRCRTCQAATVRKYAARSGR